MKRLLLLTLLTGLCCNTEAGGHRVPVMLGIHGEPELDACLSMGVAPREVQVREAPSAKARVVLTLAKGQEAFLCDSSKDGRWEGIVVPPSPGFDCGISGEWGPGPTPYRGPCKSGWVPEGTVPAVAG